MKIKNSVGKIQLKQLCEYYGLTFNIKATKTILFEILTEFDEEKFLIQKGNKTIIEELNRINFQCVPPFCRDGKLYFSNYKPNYFCNSSFEAFTMNLLNLETFEQKSFEFNTLTRHNFLHFNIFFHQNQMFGFGRSGEIFAVNLTEGTTSPSLEIQDQTLENRFNSDSYQFLQYKDSKVYFTKYYRPDCLYCIDLELKTKSEILKQKLISEQDTFIKLVCVLDQGILLKSNGIFHICDWSGNWTLIESLKHLYDANAYLHVENDLLYISNGTLFHFDSVVSNEIFVFSSKDLENPLKRFWTSQKVRCESTVVHGDYIYFLKVFNEDSKKKFGFSRTKLIENATFSSVLNNSTFSDITLIVNEKKFYSHKFILSAFTSLDLSKSELNIKMSETTFVKAIEFMYDGIVPSLDSFEISELKTNLFMKIQKSEEFFDNYKRMLNSSEFFDFVIKFDSETEFKCHKIILSRESEYFKSLFLGNFDDSNNSEICIEEISPDHMALILEYFYCKSMTTDNVELLVDLIDSSKFLICNHLNHYLNDKLLNSLNAQNVFAILKHAMKEENESLQNKCFHLIKKNYSVEELMKLFMNYSSEMFSFSLKTVAMKELQEEEEAMKEEEGEEKIEEEIKIIEFPPKKKQKK
jgi:hypothetical protein